VIGGLWTETAGDPPPPSITMPIGKGHRFGSRAKASRDNPTTKPYRTLPRPNWKARPKYLLFREHLTHAPSWQNANIKIGKGEAIGKTMGVEI
jgi:hypothetical protein